MAYSTSCGETNCSLSPSILETGEIVENPFIHMPNQSTNVFETYGNDERQLLCDDFRSCGILLDSFVTADDIISKLKNSSRIYDDEMIYRIYSSVASSNLCNGNNFVNGGKFIDAYLKRKRELSRMLLVSYEEIINIDKCLQKLQQFITTERIYPLNQNILTVQVVSVQNIDLSSIEANKLREFKLHLACQNQVIETQSVCASGGVAFFNEVFSFEINYYSGCLILSLIQIDPETQSEDLLGTCSVLLNDLIDQRLHEMSKQIWKLDCEVLMACQWIHSKPLLYHNYIKEYLVNKYKGIEEMNEYQKEYDRLDSPFMLDANHNGIIGGSLKNVPDLFSEYIDKLLGRFKISSVDVIKQLYSVFKFFFPVVIVKHIKRYVNRPSIGWLL